MGALTTRLCCRLCVISVLLLLSALGRMLIGTSPRWRVTHVAGSLPHSDRRQPVVYYGVDVPTTGAYADPHVLASLAYDVETAGWDGIFLSDVIFDAEGMHVPVVDP